MEPQPQQPNKPEPQVVYRDKPSLLSRLLPESKREKQAYIVASAFFILAALSNLDYQRQQPDALVAAIAATELATGYSLSSECHSDIYELTDALKRNDIKDKVMWALIPHVFGVLFK